MPVESRPSLSGHNKARAKNAMAPSPSQAAVLGVNPHRGLMWALGVSVALHAGLVGFRFAAPEAYNRVFQDTPLEVILVNARSREQAQEAQALAQVHLAGGGEVPEVRIASSPLLPAMNDNPGMDISEVKKQIEALKIQQMRLLSQLQDELAVLTQENMAEASDSPDREVKVQRQQQLSRQLAQIEQRVDQTQGAARKRYISPATKEVVYALYYDKMRRTIEYQGTLNFPEFAGKKMYGQLTMVITVDSRGQLLTTEVAKTSGQPLLDARAVAIVRSAAPFGLFNAKMRSQADQIVVITRFDFSRDDTLGTHMMASEEAKP
jgi:periplasmic protein TonB